MPILSAEVCDMLREIKQEIVQDPQFDMSWERCIGARLAQRVGEGHLTGILWHLLPGMGAQYGLFHPFSWPRHLAERFQAADDQRLKRLGYDPVYPDTHSDELVADVAADAIDWFIERDGPQQQTESMSTPPAISEMEPERELVGA